ncbi:hypothetical protein DSUL_50323 [Desulfovibrionales bacterium]
MFAIDPARFQTVLEQAKGSLGQSKAKFDQTKRDLARIEYPIQRRCSGKKRCRRRYDHC